MDITEKSTLWCDMDGVLAIYEKTGFAGDNPPFMQKDTHYFKTCTPDMKIINALKMLNDHNKDMHLIIISNVADTDDTIAREHAEDKREWSEKYLPFIKKDSFHAITQTKASYASSVLKRPLKRTDLLISDYNKDLTEWQRKGGTGIKYLNGINSPLSFNGHKISNDLPVEDISRHLSHLINHYIRMSFWDTIQ